MGRPIVAGVAYMKNLDPISLIVIGLLVGCLALVLTGLQGGAVLLAVLLGRVLVGMLTAEAVATVPHVSRTLVRRAAEQLPPEYRDRFAEEWEAELEAFGERRLAALKWAIGISLGARELATELAPAPQAEQAETQAEPSRDDSVVEEGPLKGWRKLGQVPVGPPIVRMPDGDFPWLPKRRWGRGGALLGHILERLKVAVDPARQVAVMTANRLGSVGNELSAYLRVVATIVQAVGAGSRDSLESLRSASLQIAMGLRETVAQAVRVMAQIGRWERASLWVAIVSGLATIFLALLIGGR